MFSRFGVTNNAAVNVCMHVSWGTGVRVSGGVTAGSENLHIFNLTRYCLTFSKEIPPIYTPTSNESSCYFPSSLTHAIFRLIKSFSILLFYWMNDSMTRNLVVPVSFPRGMQMSCFEEFTSLRVLSSSKVSSRPVL